MVQSGIFAAGNSFLHESILYQLTLYRANEGYQAYVECTAFEPNENAEPAIEPNGMTTHSARRLTKTRHRQLHGRFARKLAAREQEEVMQCSK